MERGVLRRAALRYAHRGWLVVPGAFLIGDRYACGTPCPSRSCHPAVQHWEKLASSDLSDVKHWWWRRLFFILMSTGHAVDVIEIPARLGNSAFRHAGRDIRSVRTNAHPGSIGGPPDRLAEQEHSELPGCAQAALNPSPHSGQRTTRVSSLSTDARGSKPCQPHSSRCPGTASGSQPC